MRNALIFVAVAVLSCGGPDGECRRGPSYSDWVEQYPRYRCEYTWACEDGNAGSPDSSWMEQCVGALAARLPAESDACFDSCAAHSWLSSADRRLETCAHPFVVEAENPVEYCPDGEK